MKIIGGLEIRETQDEYGESIGKGVYTCSSFGKGFAFYQNYDGNLLSEETVTAINRGTNARRRLQMHYTLWISNRQETIDGSTSASGWTKYINACTTTAEANCEFKYNAVNDVVYVATTRRIESETQLLIRYDILAGQPPAQAQITDYEHVSPHVQRVSRQTRSSTVRCFQNEMILGGTNARESKRIQIGELK